MACGLWPVASTETIALTLSLIIQTSYLGDVILTTPLIAELARHGPVDLLVTPGGADILANNPSISRTLVYDKRGSQRGLRGLREIALATRTASSDSVAYCAQGSFRTAVVALLAGYKQRVGFDTSAARWLYTRRARYRPGRHHAERLLRLALGDDVEVAHETLRPALYPGDGERRAVDALLASAGYAREPLIALAPGSVWATKRWPYYADLASRLSTAGRLVVIGSRDDHGLARAIGDACDGSAIDATGALSLLGSAELLVRCALLVTNDSAPQHLASAMGTPTLTIFGPTVPAFGFGPLAPQSLVAEHPALACRPCHPHGPVTCPLGHWRCMRELAVESVLSRVDAVA